jgi:hypothetical protein
VGRGATATPLRSRIVTTTSLDSSSELRLELDRLTAMELNQEYSDFTFGGSWSNCVLWNPTGDADDAELREFDGPSRPTGLARELPAIARLAEAVFDLRHARWVRVFKLSRGVMLPHRDYLEMDEGFTRLHLPLQTDRTCLHSEGGHVYHMRLGEIWFLETDEVHSVCALGETTRISLCVDCAPGIGFEQLVRPSLAGEHPPFLVDRAPYEGAGEAEVDRLVAGIDERTFREVVGTLSALHFRYDVHAAALYDWLVDGLTALGRDALAARAAHLRRYATEERSPGERFFDV